MNSTVVGRVAVIRVLSPTTEDTNDASLVRLGPSVL